MVQSLGPVTILMWLMHAKEGKYKNRYVDAAKRLLQNVPYGDQVVKALTCKEGPAERDLLRSVADYLLLADSRADRRGFIPPYAFSRLFFDKVDIIYDDKNFPTGYECPDTLRNFDFTNIGFWRVYRKFSAVAWRMVTRLDKTQLAQTVYHASLGTHKGDLGLLASIKNTQNWMSRSDIKDGFTLKGSNSATEFKPVEQQFFSKLAQTSQSIVTNAGMHTAISATVLCGPVDKVIDYRFFSLLASSDGVTLESQSTADITKYVAKKAQEIKNLLDNDGKLRHGKMYWFPMAEVDKNPDVMVASTQVFKETGATWMGQIEV